MYKMIAISVNRGCRATLRLELGASEKEAGCVKKTYKNKHKQVTRWEEESRNIVLLLAKRRNSPPMGTLG